MSELTLSIGKQNLIRAAVKHATFTAAYSGAEFCLLPHLVERERVKQKILRHGMNYTNGPFIYKRNYNGNIS